MRRKEAVSRKGSFYTACEMPVGMSPSDRNDFAMSYGRSSLFTDLLSSSIAMLVLQPKSDLYVFKHNCEE